MIFHKVHQDLNASNQTYASWHQHPLHSAVHWSAFLAIVILFAASLLNEIKNSFVTSYQSNSASAVSILRANRNLSLREPAQDHILFRFGGNVSKSIQSDVLRRNGITLSTAISPTGMSVGIISAGDTPDEVVQRLRHEPYISAVSVDFIGTTSAR